MRHPSLRKRFYSNYGLYLLSLVVFILGISYASVPLYQLFCQATGFGGTVKTSSIFSPHIDPPSTSVAPRDSSPSSVASLDSHTTPITISFNADISTSFKDTSNSCPLYFSFKPTINHLSVFPGDTALTFYLVKNLSDFPVSGVSTYHVSPPKVGLYFNKIQCFCFEEQRLKPHESLEMPVLFFLDSDFLSDPHMQDVDSITLSYTFFLS